MKIDTEDQILVTCYFLVTEGKQSKLIVQLTLSGLANLDWILIKNSVSNIIAFSRG